LFAVGKDGTADKHCNWREAHAVTARIYLLIKTRPTKLRTSKLLGRVPVVSPSIKKFVRF